MVLQLYTFLLSPPCRAVDMVVKAIGLEVEEKVMDMMNKAHLEPEYLKINPQHTIPTIVDTEDGFALWESHAILPFLIKKYAKKDSLYPKDLRKRAVIDQRLHFDSGVLWARITSVTVPIMQGKKSTIDEEAIKSLNEVYGFMEEFLEGKQWMAGHFPTIADYSLISSATVANLLVKVDPKKFPKLTNWFLKCETLPGYNLQQRIKDSEAFFARFLKD